MLRAEPACTRHSINRALDCLGTEQTEFTQPPGKGWACCLGSASQDHPASLPATGQTPAQNRRNDWHCQDASLLPTGGRASWGHTGMEADGAVAPWCHTPRLESCP